jgi:hypothetical protein
MDPLLEVIVSLVVEVLKDAKESKVLKETKESKV